MKYRYNNRERDRLGRFTKLSISISENEAVSRNKEYQRRYREKNRIKIRERGRIWARNNPIFGKKWVENNLERSREIKRFYKKTHPDSRLASNLRTRIVMALKNKDLLKKNKTADLIGCSVYELKLHLEKQFKDGMSWSNRGFRGWHMDHIKPVILFDLSSLDGQKKAFHFTNLQPLWAKDNLVKKDKYEVQ